MFLELVCPQLSHTCMTCSCVHCLLCMVPRTWNLASLVIGCGFPRFSLGRSLPLWRLSPSPFYFRILLFHSYRPLVKCSIDHAFLQWGLGFALVPHRCSSPGNATYMVSRSLVLTTTSLLCHRLGWMGVLSCSFLGSFYMTRGLLGFLPPNFH